jgi:hypothetical protein
VSYADWEEAGDFEKTARPGDYVEEKIVDEFLGCVPPVTNKTGFVQCGEPYSHELDSQGRFHPTFSTFVQSGDRWIYCGHCFVGQTAEPPRVREGSHVL